MDYLSLCLICKDEIDYLEEWLNFHILVGVDRFYIYDNDSQISLRETLKDYIDRGWVIVTEITGKAVQLYAYDHCLRQFGKQTRWLGFIDTDEYLVPKSTYDLKKLLKEYEAYGGLAVSSLFFGSNGHRERPTAGQLASYLLRTHPSYYENMLVKSIVQPEHVSGPASPHDFHYKSSHFCVNEQFLRVDNQRFPNSVEKIQLNHYYCRSEGEIEKKLSRGRGASKAKWSRQRFDDVNNLSSFPDQSGLDLAERLLQAIRPHSMGTEAENQKALVNRMAGPARTLKAHEITLSSLDEPLFRPEIQAEMEANQALSLAEDRGDHTEVVRLTFSLLDIDPHYIGYYQALAIGYLHLNQPSNAWQALAQAWKLAPNSYLSLKGMVFYFLQVENYTMAEKSCRLLLAIAPHDLTALAFLTHAFLGLGRFEEALDVGLPVIELASTLGELPEGMGIFLVRKMANYLTQKKEFARAAHVWEAGTKCQPGDIDTLLEWTKALLLQGKSTQARQVLGQIQLLDPEHPEAQRLLREVMKPTAGHQKRRHS